MRKRETHIVKGMSRDMSVHRFDPNLVIDARNIRITTIKDSGSLLSVTNEKGTREFTVYGTAVKGTIIGTAVLNSLLILFTTENGNDRIYKLKFSDDFSSATSYLLFPETINDEKSLNFQVEHPLETLPVYENEDIQKVYWVDGINQPRMINVAGDTGTSNEDLFNFNRKIDGKHTMTIEKYNTGGEFPAGTVQYCFNYFNKFGQETNIVDQSPLYYLCPKETGLPADAVSTSSFLITLEGLDSNYEYVRIYSIVRTSENATPNVRIVGDYKISSLRYIGSWIQETENVRVSLDNMRILNVSSKTTRALTAAELPEIGAHSTINLSEDEYLYDVVNNKAYWYQTSGLVGAHNGLDVKLAWVNFYEDAEGYYLKSSRSGDLFSGTLVDEPQAITVVDNGIVGSTIDAYSLLFIGGQKIIADTFTSKSNTLFLGNIKQGIPNIGTLSIDNSQVKDIVRGSASACAFDYRGKEKQAASFIESVADAEHVASAAFYKDPIDNNKSSYDTKSFKTRECYRLGFIAQYETGQWSEAVWIDDLEETFAPGRNVFYKYRTLSIGEGEVEHYDWGPSYRKPGFKAVLSSAVVNALKANGFIRVAPVAIYPSYSERRVLCQGLVLTTVFNVNDRYDNSPFAQSDWRVRSGYNWENIVGEIQCNPFGYADTVPGNSSLTSKVFIDNFPTEYYRDPSIVSFYSPDIEAQEELYQSDFENTVLKIVGFSNKGFNSDNESVNPETVIDTFLNTSTQGFNPTYSAVNPFTSGSVPTHRRSGSNQVITRYTDGDTDLSYPGYIDSAVRESTTSGHEGEIEEAASNTIHRWITYLWHRNGSLNNQAALSAKAQKAGSLRYAMLGKKIISEIRYARTTFFQNDNANSFGPFDIIVPIDTPKLVNSEQASATRFSAQNQDGLFYYSNIDKVLAANFKNLSSVTIASKWNHSSGYNLSNGYPILYEGTYRDSDNNTVDPTYGGRRGRVGPTITNVSRFSTGGESSDDNGSYSGDLSSGFYGKDPISIKYKTGKHLVIGLSSDSDGTINQLGDIPTFANSDSLFNKPFWKESTCLFNNVLASSLEDTLNGFSGLYNTVLIGEIHRTFSPEQEAVRFGGTSDQAIVNGIWKRCGDSVPLEEDESATLYFKEGDTYIGRYDCLKSYPSTDEDQNQIVSIYSTELESRVNLDARYDKNRGLASNLYMRPRNFGLFNHPGYEQSNQYFTYKGIDYDKYQSLSHPNMLTWTLEKKMGADIDAWTSVSLVSTADAQGDLGEIVKLTNFNNSIYSFQNKGIAQALFNERVQVPVSDGQPIEITNGYKFEGFRYITNQIGLSNKWSLCTTPNGMYFVDDEKNTLYIFNGQQLQDLSSKYGFRTWFSAIDSHDVWNPSDYTNLRTFYDKVNGDVYFMTDEESLVFSEQIGTFTSFMDYMKLPAMVNVNDKFLTFTESPDNRMVRTWELFAGDFNDFFGILKPYWITFVSNTDPTVDKVYDNLAWRTFEYSDVTDDFQGTIQPLKTFNSLRVWNDHQDTGEVALYDQEDNMKPILKKKFNVFRTYVPRDRYGTWRGKGMNRIRNTWSYIRLSKVNPGNDLLMFSDLDVDFFE